MYPTARASSKVPGSSAVWCVSLSRRAATGTPTSEGLIVSQGWPLFAYNFVCFGLTGFLGGLWLAAIGLIDLVFAITLIAGTAMLASFLPRTYGDCNSAYEWRDGPDGRNFFSEAVRGGQWNGYRKAEDLCHGMVQHWAFCIAAT